MRRRGYLRPVCPLQAEARVHNGRMGRDRSGRPAGSRNILGNHSGSVSVSTAWRNSWSRLFVLLTCLHAFGILQEMPLRHAKDAEQS
jgi:hypothetical protein